MKIAVMMSFSPFFFLFCVQLGDINLENVTHEDAVAALKSIVDRVTLVVAKQNPPDLLESFMTSGGGSMMGSLGRHQQHHQVDGRPSPSPPCTTPVVSQPAPSPAVVAPAPVPVPSPAPAPVQPAQPVVVSQSHAVATQPVPSR